ncbi:MAG: hypothetical protein KKB65_01725 [Nanoarchaeota archaeon]|nr:hypothetical protein [Nanoarchaeota archaeon]
MKNNKNKQQQLKALTNTEKHIQETKNLYKKISEDKKLIILLCRFITEAEEDFEYLRKIIHKSK